MAEPNDKINLANPTEVARETLRRLALRRIAPTPDNYQTLYEEIVGAPSAPAADPNAPSAATALSGLVLDLNRQYPELAVPVETLNQAIRKGDWTQCRWVVFHGTAGDPADPHYDDQSEAWRTGRTVPMHYDWSTIAATARRHVRFQPA